MDPMRGKTVRNPSTQVGADTYHRWDFKNETNTEICDFHLDTNRTYGNDPDMRGLKVQSPDGSVTYYSDDTFPDTTSKHVTLDNCIPKDAEFKILVKFDDSFESDESIEILPSDSDGAVIEGPRAEEVAVAPPAQKDFSLGQLAAWSVGSGIGAGIAGAALTSPGGPTAGAGFVIGFICGAIGGALGVVGTYYLDAPRIEWNPRSAFLFGLHVTLLLSFLFGLQALEVSVQANASGVDNTPYIVLVYVVLAVAGFLASASAGVINNLLMGKGTR